MTQLNAQTAVGTWAAQRPETARTLEELGIDYCCGGAQSLASACAARGLELDAVLQQLAQAAPIGEDDGQRWDEAPLAALCDHIEQTHHAYLKAELPRLAALFDKVLAAHGEQHPELADARRAFQALQAELVPHMFKEEHILFPALRLLERQAEAQFPFGSVANPIRMMEHEHEQAGDALRQIRSSTSDFRVPEDGCASYRTLFAGLSVLERNMFQHVHKENNILFPRAQQLEQGV